MIVMIKILYFTPSSFVVINPRVLSANIFDFGPYLFQEFSNLLQFCFIFQPCIFGFLNVLSTKLILGFHPTFHSLPFSLEVVLRGEAVEKTKPGDTCKFSGQLIAVPDISTYSGVKKWGGGGTSSCIFPAKAIFIPFFLSAGPPPPSHTISTLHIYSFWTQFLLFACGMILFLISLISLMLWMA